ncbi:hypothetical protein BDY24DRAFT_388573 [Mrakia frigida]|uniref:uncharacterized protein n=1 Tax=Mrakia frigida TaxID=29902 RepID=UPI003FCC1E03
MLVVSHLFLPFLSLFPLLSSILPSLSSSSLIIRYPSFVKKLVIAERMRLRRADLVTSFLCTQRDETRRGTFSSGLVRPDLQLELYGESSS